MSSKRPIKATALVGFSGLALCMLLFVVQPWERDRAITGVGSQNGLIGPALAYYKPAPLPTSTATAVERILLDANIYPGRYTLGDLADGLGPPDLVNIGIFGAEDPRRNAIFFYVTKGLICNTEWDPQFKGIKRQMVAECYANDYDPAVWTERSNWFGFDD